MRNQVDILEASQMAFVLSAAFVLALGFVGLASFGLMSYGIFKGYYK